ncbi:hypothetical protein ASD65_13220 [Microbacterium sp. Root61]|uniref:zinc-binding dehydrogenase n=1 Tax=Microbacterium sp. Root61 TaxID=1736570 RepID=UPI0006F1E455|nr:zinc-binding dehydrogenase [Microbacterium sp. Root61]KRA25273.1 hypothetical protein ASD65_13220 [Microbacterium sp. Root61]
MLGLVWDGLELAPQEAIELRTPVGDDVVVEVDVAGLCHSDLKPIDGDIPQELPVILGHEAVGRVVARGPSATIPLGQRVVMTVLRPCGQCADCLAGRRIRCRATATPPASPFSRDGRSIAQFVRLGAFARRTLVSESQVIPVGDDLSDEIMAMISCATVTAFGAVEERARVEAGESVMITGAGGIGLNAIIAARAAGARRVAVFDINPRKEDIARRCGATDFVLSSDRPISDVALELEPDGFDAVLECVGMPALLEQAVRSLAWGGRVVIVGLPPHGAVLPLEIRSLFNDRSILGCRMGSVDPWTMIPRLVERCTAGELDLGPLVSKTVIPSEIQELVAELRSGSLERGFIDFRQES